MSQERRKTRDLLLEYSIMPFHPRVGGLSIVYPWENMDVSTFEKQFYKMAKNHGYNGTEEDFWEMFSSSNVLAQTAGQFPVPGKEENLYYDYTTGIVYSFKNITDSEIVEELVNNGAKNVGQSEDGKTFYVYAPIQSLPMEDIIVYGVEPNG